MEHSTSEPMATAWLLAAAAGTAELEGDSPEPGEAAAPGVLISVSLDELDGLSGELLV